MGETKTPVRHILKDSKMYVATINQVLDFSIIGLVGSAALFVGSGLVATTIACWKDATRSVKPLETVEPQIQPEPEIEAPPEATEYACPLTCDSGVPESTEYACPLTCELPETPLVVEVETIQPTEKVEKKEDSRKMTKTQIAKLNKKQAIATLEKWAIDPAQFKTLVQMKKALAAVAV